jgi:hypothetical protein
MSASFHSADRILTWGLLVGGVSGSVVLLSVVALPLTLSTPFPELRDGAAWVIDNPPMSYRLASITTEEPLTDGRETDGRLIVASVVDSPDQPVTFAERWNSRVPQAAIVARGTEEIEVEAPWGPAPDAGAKVAPKAAKIDLRSDPKLPSVAKAPAGKHMASEDPVVEYLWEVYQRKPVKSDSSGDFTWKDQAAAKRLNISMKAYVIGGMDPDFREQLYHAGHAMDAAGLNWSMLSAFRDDYRQGLASGFKAHGGNSQHGGSRATGGYGHGRAIDIAAAEGDSDGVWHWVDSHGGKYGLARPMTRIDPAHIVTRGSYHDLAHNLRDARHKLEAKLNAEASPASTKVASHTAK